MTVHCQQLDPARSQQFRDWTFPAFRHLLDLAPSVRHPKSGDRRRIRPLAFLAEVRGSPAGLVLGSLPEDDHEENDPELLSVFVAGQARRQGVAKVLLARLEETVRDAGFPFLHTVYMTGPPEIDFFERILREHGWSAPEARMLVVKSTLDEATATPWYRRYRKRSSFEFFPWKDLSQEELERLRRSHEKDAWIADDLRPWHYDVTRMEPASSLGIRLGGEVVGWVINHPIDEQTLRFTCSYIRPDLARRGRIVPAYSESIHRAREAGFKRLTLTVPMQHREMVVFVRRWCAPWVSFLGETRGSKKTLVEDA